MCEEPAECHRRRQAPTEQTWQEVLHKKRRYDHFLVPRDLVDFMSLQTILDDFHQHRTNQCSGYNDREETRTCECEQVPSKLPGLVKKLFTDIFCAWKRSQNNGAVQQKENRWEEPTNFTKEQTG